MNDCPNADMRDLLPDLVHGNLDASAQRMAEAHLATCAECRAELELLQQVRATLHATPVVDLGAITAALPAYRAPARRSWVGWRVAAVITIVASGASSLLVARRAPRVPDSATVLVADKSPVALPAAALPPAAPESAAVNTGVTRSSVVPQPVAGIDVPAGERELAMTGGTLSDLSDQELATLLREIDTMDALPSVDVESASAAPLAPRRGAP